MRRLHYLTIGTFGPLCGLLLGCDGPVKQTVISGFQDGSISIATALLQAMFEMIKNNESTAVTSAMLDTAFRLVAMVF